jgi:hypothetical protein
MSTYYEGFAEGYYDAAKEIPPNFEEFPNTEYKRGYIEGYGFSLMKKKEMQESTRLGREVRL